MLGLVINLALIPNPIYFTTVLERMSTGKTETGFKRSKFKKNYPESFGRVKN